jgi:hypothetical protein
MQPTTLKRLVWSRGRPGTLGVLRLLSGVVLLLALGASSSHSHAGHLSSSHHCPVCQVAGQHLDAVPDLAVVPPPVVTPEECEPSAPHAAPSARFPSSVLPRGPPFVA